MLGYVLLSGRLLWKMWIIFGSEPTTNRIGFFAPSIAMFGLLQYYKPRPTLQATQVDNEVRLLHTCDYLLTRCPGTWLVTRRCWNNDPLGYIHLHLHILLGYFDHRGLGRDCVIDYVRLEKAQVTLDLHGIEISIGSQVRCLLRSQTILRESIRNVGKYLDKFEIFGYRQGAVSYVEWLWTCVLQTFCTLMLWGAVSKVFHSRHALEYYSWICR